MLYEVITSNQDGLGTDSFPTPTFVEPHAKMNCILKNEGVVFDAEHIDPSLPEENSPNRKPRTGMLTGYLSAEYDIKNSYVIGDRVTDVELAKNLGCKAIWINSKNNDAVEINGLSKYCALTTTDWDEVTDFLLKPNQSYSVTRNTKETKINLTLHRDNISKTSINSGLKFFDHMLEQLARHSGCGLELHVDGDLEVDEHHTIEDVAIALGEAYNQLLGDKRGINRFV